MSEDRLVQVPIYRAVAERIMTRIESGTWGVGTVLPAEVVLAREFGVSVGTVRRALSELTSNGMLARRRRTGTVVTGRTPHHSLQFFYDYFRLHSRDGKLQVSTTRILNQMRRRPTCDEATCLNIDKDAFVHVMHRLRLVDARPVMHETVVLPAALVPGFPEDHTDVPERLYQALWRVYGLKIAAIRERIGAELATEVDCDLLGLAPPAAVLTLHEVAYDEMARPILLNLHRATTESDVYINEIQ